MCMARGERTLISIWNSSIYDSETPQYTIDHENDIGLNRVKYT